MPICDVGWCNGLAFHPHTTANKRWLLELTASAFWEESLGGWLQWFSLFMPCSKHVCTTDHYFPLPKDASNSANLKANRAQQSLSLWFMNPLSSILTSWSWALVIGPNRDYSTLCFSSMLPACTNKFVTKCVCLSAALKALVKNRCSVQLEVKSLPVL